MSNTMIYRGESEEEMRKDSINLSAGMGLIENIIIDTHFVERGRFTRFMQIVSMNRKNMGIGIREDAAVIVHTIVKGHKYDLCEKRFLESDDLKKLDNRMIEEAANEDN